MGDGAAPQPAPTKSSSNEMYSTIILFARCRLEEVHTLGLSSGFFRSMVLTRPRLRIEISKTLGQQYSVMKRNRRY